ncbi:MAG: hypothetical protein HS116_05835 [Planctomycetes bacterium]|nr:hypothetical protein [Planctomycetota bacterium]
MDPVTIGILIITAALATAFWPWIVEFFTEHVIPWLKQYCGHQIGKLVADMVAWLNGKLNPIRALLRKMIDAFKTNVLGIQTTYKKVSSTECVAESVTLIRQEDGQIVRKVPKGIVVQWDELPDEVCSEMIKQQKKAAMVNVREMILAKAEERAAFVIQT